MGYGYHLYCSYARKSNYYKIIYLKIKKIINNNE